MCEQPNWGSLLEALSGNADTWKLLCGLVSVGHALDVDTWQGLGTSLLQGRMLLGRHCIYGTQIQRAPVWGSSSCLCKKSAREAHLTCGGKTKEMCHRTYKMCFLMAEWQNALASWISKAAPFMTVAWLSKRRTSQSLSTAVSENWSTTILQPCLCCKPWKASSCTAGFCASINKRIEKENLIFTAIGAGSKIETLQFWFCWCHKETVPLCTQQAILIPNSHTFMLMLAASSGKVKITKPDAKKQYVFLGDKWTNKCGIRYHALACERNGFLRNPPPLWYWLPQNKLFPSQLLPVVTSDKAIARQRFLHTTFLLPEKAGGNLSVQQESITQHHCKHFLAY